MRVARVTIAGWAVASLVVGAVSCGCGNGNRASLPSAASSTSVPSAQPNDYSGLLIKASDIPGDFNAPQPPVLNPNGAVGDNSQAITVLLFTEGKALVNLEFDSAPNDPLDADVAKDIARKQDAAIKKGLPG